MDVALPRDDADRIVTGHARGELAEPAAGETSTVTLAQILSEAGFATIGLTEGGYVGRDYGFGRGFDVYSENRPELAATLDSARELLAEHDAGKPFFLFLHTYDIHCPYEPPEESVKLFRTADESPIETRGACGKEYNAARLTAGQVRRISNHYDAGVHAVDALLGGFLDELEEAGTLDNTYVIVTSDHGEQLYEHGRIGHERSVNREALRVPWIVRGPGVTPRRITASTGLVDMTPTLLELVGVEVPASMEGVSRANWLLGKVAAPSEGAPRVSQLSWKVNLQSVMTPTHQLIVDRDQDRATLYEFPDSVGETELAPGSHIEDELRAVLEAHFSAASPRDTESVDEPDPEQREKLRALGYGE